MPLTKTLDPVHSLHKHLQDLTLQRHRCLRTPEELAPLGRHKQALTSASPLRNPHTGQLHYIDHGKAWKAEAEVPGTTRVEQSWTD